MGVFDRLFKKEKPVSIQAKDIISSTRRYKPETVKRDKYVSSAWLEYNPDRLLSDTGNTIELYEKMLLDATIKAGIQIRKDITLSVDWSIEPADGEDREAEKQADFVKEVLDNLENIPFLDFLDNFLDYEWYGYMVAEPRWASDGQHWIYTDLKCKDPDDFNFQVDEYGNLLTVKFGFSDELDPERLIIGVYPYVQNGNYYGKSCLQSIYREWWSKTNVIKFRNMYLQNRGSAPMIGIYPEGDSNAKTAVETILDSIQNDFWTSMPGYRGPDGEWHANLGIKLLEVATSKGTSEFEAAIQQLDTAITRGLLLPDNLGFTDTAVGSYAQTKIQFRSVIYGLKKRLARLEDIVNQQIIKPLLAINFDKPRRVRLKFEELEDEMSESKANVLKTLVDAGIVDPKETFIRSYMNIPETIEKIEEEEENIPQPPPMQPGAQPGQPVVPPTEEEQQLLKEYHIKKHIQAKAYKKTINFKAIESELNKIEKDMIVALGPVFDEVGKEIVKQVRTKVLATNDVAALPKVRVYKLGKIRDVFLQGMTSAYLQGKADVAGEIKDYTGKDVVDMGAWDELPLDSLTMGGMDEWIKQYGAKLTKADREALRQIAQKSYSIAGDDIIESIMLDVRKTVRTGIGIKPTEQIVREVNGIINAFYNQALADPNVPLTYDTMMGGPVGRLKTIVRNATTTEYNQGRAAQALDPDLEGFVEAAQYSAVIDEATTPFCEAHDGEVVDVGSTDYAILTPPNHHNCRSVWVYFFKGEDWKKDWAGKTDKQLESYGLTRETYTNGYSGFGKA